MQSACDEAITFNRLPLPKPKIIPFFWWTGTEPGFEPEGGQSLKQLFFFNENKKLTPISYSTKYYI